MCFTRQRQRALARPDACQTLDVEAQRAGTSVDGFLVGREQIEEKGTQARRVELPRHCAVARTQADPARTISPQRALEFLESESRLFPTEPVSFNSRP